MTSTSQPSGGAPAADPEIPSRAGAPLLTLSHASKAFAGVHALQDVSIELYPGEVHALVGENGAGKSTLVKILAGVHQPDSGVVTIDGEPVLLQGPADASARGITVIYQEPTLFPDLSVAENVFLGRQPLQVGRRIDHRRMNREVKEIFERLRVPIDPERIARGLSIAEQQIVEIAKALSRRARVLIMDEPTAALSPVEAQRLFGVVETLKAEGTAIVFISHRLEEIFALCQSATVLRDGTLVLSRPLAGMTHDDLVRAMVGRDVVISRQSTASTPGDVVLKVEHLTREGEFFDISLEVRAGEIVALAGLVGSGRTEVARAIFGIDRHDVGSVEVNGRTLPNGIPSAAMNAGVGLVPEDRRQHGLVMEMTVLRNIALGSMRELTDKFGLIPERAERNFAHKWADKLQVKYGSDRSLVQELSGGNQQKVVLARWLARQPKLLIVDEPTRGIDIGTKAEVHRLLHSLAADGVAVLVISSELPEVLAIADRILVMREGRIAKELVGSEATEEQIVGAGTSSASTNGSGVSA
jgi:rhamnose transport system ATP-binding protein